MLEKDESIIDLISRLTERMGENRFDIVDHWEMDLCAVGLGRSDNHDVLVYISTCGRSPEEYYVSLELPPTPGDDYPYTPAGDFEVQGLENLVEMIKNHFASYP